MSIPSSCKVLVIGGGIVGLTASAFLAKHGVDTVLVERRTSPSKRLRAKFFYPRTIELYRSLGIEQKITTPPGTLSEAAIVHSLTGDEIRRWTLPAVGESAASPCVASSIKQQDLECVVRDTAERLGARIHFAHALTALEQHEDGATATIKAANGTETLLHADFVIACDGSKSIVRDLLGIGTVGLGDLVHSMSITIRCDIREALRGRPLSFAWVQQPDISGFMSWSTDLTSVVLSIEYDLTNPADIARFTPENCHALAARCLGLPSQQIEVVDIHSWCLSSWYAESFRKGRIFLAGDAIHSTPPLGGFGANTGIHDAHNLALKLVSVIQHNAPQSLLDLYEAERAPVVQMVVAQATARLAQRSNVQLPLEALQPVLDEDMISMGYRYPILAHVETIPNPIVVHPRDLHAEPGTRAPHIWLHQAGVRLSSLDLFGESLVLLAGNNAESWCRAAETSCRLHGLPVQCLAVGRDLQDPESAFPAAYGISDTGAVLVRADGFVIWKAVRTGIFRHEDLLKILRSAHEAC
ncbi:2-polyprenyl-6-methoxyphenol hydroxylase-like FAD-dependent oxidoreductase [Gluconobacter cerinus]|uniref:FAD-dependent monooxygenase n=1 Tax=Gluconobacter cerinus TaxID=38307 RepID=UPI0022276803|nr:FAD-dependent monooxygenase [Gluconobacter cerinus]MCW2266763.1 2-polyprenyl-6-methoxyphenol hydroxylase-like FAD-dependent oxidoreductase [Gluconobacter cerinus]